MKTRNQNGSALTEFAIMTVVAVPLFTMLPMLGKVSDINQSTIQASRYGAWERTVSDKTNDKLVTEVNNRFFSTPETGIKTGRAALLGEDHQNIFWSGFGADNRFLTTGDGVLSASADDDGLSGSAGKLADGIVSMGETIAGMVPGAEWDLKADGLYVSRVGANISGNSMLHEGKDCSGAKTDKSFTCVVRQNAILTDSWGASSAEHVESRTKSLVPLGALEPVGKGLAAVGKALPIFQELEGLEDAFGMVKPDILPPDRHDH